MTQLATEEEEREMELGPNQKAWIQALRSGKYKQAKKRLKTENGFCCLGVACDLTGEDWEVDYQDDRFSDEKLFSFKGARSVLPPSVKDWLDLASDAGVIQLSINIPFIPVIEVGSRSLAQMNDDGASFEEIAAILEGMPQYFFNSSC